MLADHLHGERRTANGARGTGNGERRTANEHEHEHEHEHDWGPELRTPNSKPQTPPTYGRVGMNGPFALAEICRRHRKKKKIEPNAPPKATRKSRIALKTLSSLKSSPAATEPMPRKTRLAPAWRTIWRTLRTFFGVLADDSGQGFQSP